jgi:hypothetical protein
MDDSQIKFDLASLLKAKGFNGLSHDLFIKNGDRVHNVYVMRWNESDDHVTQPTYQEAIDWLRNTHNIHVYNEGDNWDSYLEFDGYKGIAVKTKWKTASDAITLFESKEVKPYYVSLAEAITEALTFIQ